MSKPPSETTDDIEEQTLFNLPYAERVKRCGTRTDEFVYAPWACNYGRNMKVTKHTHYRLVLKVFSYSLKDFKGTREMFEATHDAFEALISAYSKCHILPHDVSVNNVILVRDPATNRRKGILIDWELSTLADNNGEARDYHRSGTWAFMSAEALSNYIDFRHKIQDDMESLLYIVLYCCVRWLPHNRVEGLGKLMFDFFDDYKVHVNGTIIGGGEKKIEQFDRTFTKLFNFENSAIQSWITVAFSYLAPNYLVSRVSAYERVKNKWTPESFGKLWVAIQKHTLPENDKMSHDVSDKHEDSSFKHNEPLPRSTQFSEVYEEPVKEQVCSSKRSRSDVFEDADEENDGGSSKRHRMTPVAEYNPGTQGGGPSEPYIVADTAEWNSELRVSD